MAIQLDEFHLCPGGRGDWLSDCQLVKLADDDLVEAVVPREVDSEADKRKLVLMQVKLGFGFSEMDILQTSHARLPLMLVFLNVLFYSECLIYRLRWCWLNSTACVRVSTANFIMLTVKMRRTRTRARFAFFLVRFLVVFWFLTQK